MNLVALIGNACAEPEIRYTASGKAVCHFRIAVSRSGGDSADYFDIVTWERQAEVCKEYIQVGRRVSVEGRLHSTHWENAAGNQTSAVEIIASRVSLLGKVESDV